MKVSLVVVALFALLFPATAGSAASAASERASKRVWAFNNYFSPRTIKVNRGTRVTWFVRQGIHNVRGTHPRMGIKSPYLSKGRTYSKTFNRSATYTYVCTVHRGMKGKVVVRR